MEVRYRKYMDYGNKSAAHQFLLTDFEDKTEYLTMQMFKDNAINICMNSTFEFIRHVVRSIKDMHVDIQPLRTLHIGGNAIQLEYFLAIAQKSPLNSDIKAKVVF